MGDSFALLFSLVANNLQLHRRGMMNGRKCYQPVEFRGESVPNPLQASKSLGVNRETKNAPYTDPLSA
jgi:hypothetical protein